MERRQIRELIGRFLHNDVPGELQTQFRRWMLQPGDGDEKEAALREEWTAVVESPAAADRSEELQRLRHTIRMREAQQRRSRIFRRIRYAAAAAAVLLFAPILAPIAVAMGVHPVHFAVVMIVNLTIGLITPPVGVVLYATSNVGKLKFEQVVKSTMPLILLAVVILLLVTFIPELSLFLPRLLGFID